MLSRLKKRRPTKILKRWVYMRMLLWSSLSRKRPLRNKIWLRESCRVKGVGLNHRQNALSASQKRVAIKHLTTQNRFDRFTLPCAYCTPSSCSLTQTKQFRSSCALPSDQCSHQTLHSLPKDVHICNVCMYPTLILMLFEIQDANFFLSNSSLLYPGEYRVKKKTECDEVMASRQLFLCYNI